ncbi:hypothetical protein [Kingella negevensis]|uniref:hypothetical protein n=1 Tax=Kingella negevensis TaxID=1522312 RepID=UPI00254ACD1B|nr:hypothetical protein [Kingella negevensis]MDK4679309.1 hypothetical protein [Kingella negevensis]
MPRVFGMGADCFGNRGRFCLCRSIGRIADRIGRRDDIGGECRSGSLNKGVWQPEQRGLAA